MTSCFVSGDLLLNQTSENQVFAIDTEIDATDAVDSASKMDWIITTSGAIKIGILTDTMIDGDWGEAYLSPKGREIADSSQPTTGNGFLHSVTSYLPRAF